MTHSKNSLIQHRNKRSSYAATSQVNKVVSNQYGKLSPLSKVAQYLNTKQTQS